MYSHVAKHWSLSNLENVRILENSKALIRWHHMAVREGRTADIEEEKKLSETPGSSGYMDQPNGILKMS